MDPETFGFLRDLPSLLPGRGSLAYYLACAAGFSLLGFVVGYFVWRKGHMRTIDAETEVHRAGVELEALREELGREEARLQGQAGKAV
jgi:hypothetical protein